MSRTLSFRGKLAMGSEERISLHTNTGQIGYKITKFQIVSESPGASSVEQIGQIFKISVSPASTIDFSDNTLLGIAMYHDHADASRHFSNYVIFDNEIFNQDIFINITDAAGGITEGNYYIEVEVFDLALDEATVATLKDIRNND